MAHARRTVALALAGLVGATAAAAAPPAGSPVPAGATASAQPRPADDATRAAVLEQVIGLARQYGLQAQRVDWPAVAARAQAQLAARPDEAGLALAVRGVLAALGDRHSTYRPAASAPSATGTPAPARAPGGAPAGATPPRAPVAPIAEAGHSPAGWPWLAVNGWATPAGPAAVPAMQAAAAEVRGALAGLLTTPQCGLVLDLGANPGGNMWPMLGGLLPLTEPGLLLSFEEREGQRRAVEHVDGALRADGRPHPATAAALAPVAHRPRHVAVLVGPRTASSGEILAIALRTQPGVRLFGAPSAGVPTSNRSFRLPNGGLLALTTAHVLDRAGQRAEGPLLPDTAAEDALAAAEAWLATACAAPGG